jgi:hypothetical protein
MPRLSRILLTLGVVLTIASALILSGCAATDGQATEEDVNNKSFTFPNGTVFHPALISPTTLEFTKRPTPLRYFPLVGQPQGATVSARAF